MFFRTPILEHAVYSLMDCDNVLETKFFSHEDYYTSYMSVIASFDHKRLKDAWEIYILDRNSTIFGANKRSLNLCGGLLTIGNEDFKHTYSVSKLKEHKSKFIRYGFCEKDFVLLDTLIVLYNTLNKA